MYALALGLPAHAYQARAVASEFAGQGAAKVAVIGVTGVLYPSTYGEIRGALRRALADQSVSRIVLHVDSPGGICAGCLTLAEEIFAARAVKPIVAYVPSCATSAGYAVASGASRIIVDQTATVGSIGVIVEHFDLSEMLAQQGIKPTLIHSRAHKADFSPLRPLSESARQEAQEGVDQLAGLFCEMVARHRGLKLAAVEAMESRMFLGMNAIGLGLADAVGTLDDAMEIQNLIGRPKRTPRASSGPVAARMGTTPARKGVPAAVPVAETRIGAPQSPALPRRTPGVSMSTRLNGGRAAAPAVRIVNSFEAAGAVQPLPRFGTGPARPSLEQIARECLHQAGVNTASMSPDDVFAHAMNGIPAVSMNGGGMTTSDFPNVLGEILWRVLDATYKRAPFALKRILKQGSARDFRYMKKIRLSEFPELEPLTEKGEVTFGAIDDSQGEVYAVGTFARILPLSRRIMINDDLGAIETIMQGAGHAALSTEARVVLALLSANNGRGVTMSDGKSLFHADHGNLAAAGSALSVESLGEGRHAMRQQKGIGTDEPINIEPKYLVVPSKLETRAEQVLAELVATSVDEVNPFAKKLELVVEPRLDRISPTRWYLAADNAWSAIEFSYLQNQTGPQVEMQRGWTTDGVQIRCMMDFGSGAVDFRGIYANDGQ